MGAVEQLTPHWDPSTDLLDAGRAPDHLDPVAAPSHCSSVLDFIVSIFRLKKQESLDKRQKVPECLYLSSLKRLLYLTRFISLLWTIMIK